MVRWVDPKQHLSLHPAHSSPAGWGREKDSQKQGEKKLKSELR